MPVPLNSTIPRQAFDARRQIAFALPDDVALLASETAIKAHSCREVCRRRHVFGLRAPRVCDRDNAPVLYRHRNPSSHLDPSIRN
jgi:hypothetical protein